MLILVDAVRCPRDKPKERSRTLGYFYEHLAKGIYAEASNWRPADFAEVSCLVNHAREENYLDGPDDVDWIFPNFITQRCEDGLYVGYIRDDTEEGSEGERCWTSALDLELGLPHTPAVIVLVRALHQTNATTSGGLSVIAEIWRSVEVCGDMQFADFRKQNLRTLQTLEDRSLLAHVSDETYGAICNDWLFPLWPLDLKIREVKKKDLRETRKQRPPYDL